VAVVNQQAKKTRIAIWRGVPDISACNAAPVLAFHFLRSAAPGPPTQAGKSGRPRRIRP
jgi:hypothetical protein